MGDDVSLVSGLDDIAVVTLTRQGIDVAADLEAKLPANVTVYISSKYDEEAPANWTRFPRRIYPLVDEIWARHEALVFVMAAGIVVRAIAKHVQSKLFDPGVVVMDIKELAVAMCSGHLGGSNELCRMIEERLGSVGDHHGDGRQRHIGARCARQTAGCSGRRLGTTQVGQWCIGGFVACGRFR